MPGDVVDAATRSRMMSAIRGKNTKPELAIRRGLHALGYRFRLHDRSLPGTPDLVLARWKAVVEVNGCFWHGHDCVLFRLPQTRREFWQDKIAANRRRDAETAARLGVMGWRTAVVWECALKGSGRLSEDAIFKTLSAWLRGSTATLTVEGRRATATVSEGA